MIKRIEIDIPDGFELDTLSFPGVVKIKKIIETRKDITERVTSLLDAIDILGEEDEEVIKYRKVLSVLGYIDSIVSYQALVVVIKALNEEWIPDWDDNKQDKYFNHFVMGGSSGFRFFGYDLWTTNSNVGSRLCCKDVKLAKYAANQFLVLYKNALV